MELHDRLTAARVAAGYASASDAATALGVKYPTYAGHENGSSGFRNETGERYARKFKVRFEWLMRGIGPMRADGATLAADPIVEVAARILPQLSPERRQRFLADLQDAARLAGVEGAEAEPADPGGKTGG